VFRLNKILEIMLILGTVLWHLTDGVICYHERLYLGAPETHVFIVELSLVLRGPSILVLLLLRRMFYNVCTSGGKVSL
jgi:hypothetical protein